ncbi:MAG: isopentenyl phosphate kinase [Halobacteriaceae archaeon]
MIALKLGGSVITEKDREETIDDAALDRVAATVAGHSDPIVVVHGGGSFGHPAAQRYGLSPTDGTRDAAAVRDIHDAMRRLNDAVVDRLADHGGTPVPVHPFSVGHRGHDGELTFPTSQIATLLEEGFCPVLHGDVVAHAGRGATILSGDELVVALATGLDADRIGLCTTVPGVLDAEDTVIPRIESRDAVTTLGASDATDVTGGMAAKVEALLGAAVPATIFGVEDLATFLAGEPVGTTVDGS